MDFHEPGVTRRPPRGHAAVPLWLLPRRVPPLLYNARHPSSHMAGGGIGASGDPVSGSSSPSASLSVLLSCTWRRFLSRWERWRAGRGKVLRCSSSGWWHQSWRSGGFAVRGAGLFVFLVKRLLVRVCAGSNRDNDSRRGASPQGVPAVAPGTAPGPVVADQGSGTRPTR